MPEFIQRLRLTLTALVPGIALCMFLAFLGFQAQQLLQRISDQQVIEGLVIAMLLGIAWRNTIGCSTRVLVGARFAAKEVLELAVLLLGASIDLKRFWQTGFFLLAGVATLVIVVILFTFWFGKKVGLSRNVALLLGVGQGICGNSAIAAVAPLIAAEPDEVASSIGFTAVISVFVVIALPLLLQVFPLTDERYGMVAGLTVYAVPQVLAATYSVSAKSVAVATLVKLIRVLFLTPVVLFLGSRQAAASSAFKWSKLLPWFLLGFLFLATLRTLALIPASSAESLRDVGRVLTMIAMGGIGLCVDLRVLARSGKAIVITVLASLVVLLSLSLTLAYWLPLAF